MKEDKDFKYCEKINTHVTNLDVISTNLNIQMQASNYKFRATFNIINRLDRITEASFPLTNQSQWNDMLQGKSQPTRRKTTTTTKNTFIKSHRNWNFMESLSFNAHLCIAHKMYVISIKCDCSIQLQVNKCSNRKDWVSNQISNCYICIIHVHSYLINLLGIAFDAHSSLAGFKFSHFLFVLTSIKIMQSINESQPMAGQ